MARQHRRQPSLKLQMLPNEVHVWAMPPPSEMKACAGRACWFSLAALQVYHHAVLEPKLAQHVQTDLLAFLQFHDDAVLAKHLFQGGQMFGLHLVPHLLHQRALHATRLAQLHEETATLGSLLLDDTHWISTERLASVWACPKHQEEPACRVNLHWLAQILLAFTLRTVRNTDIIGRT